LIPHALILHVLILHVLILHVLILHVLILHVLILRGLGIGRARLVCDDHCISLTRPGNLPAHPVAEPVPRLPPDGLPALWAGG
jgi:hypothetical protein